MSTKKLWNKNEIRSLRAAAKRKERVADVARRLGRTPAAAQQKALREGIAFR